MSEVGIPMLRLQMIEIINVVMATNYTLWIHVIKILHSHQEYTVDLCIRKLKLDIATRHTKWIYVSIQIINTPSQPGPKMMRSRVFNPVVRKYESSHVITGVEVEHGRNHLITGH
jgi:hypothetical protein